MGAHRHGGRASLSAVAGFACNQGFVFSLFYMGANRAFGDGVLSFERADLFGTLLFMMVSFALLRVASPKARGALLARPLLWCYAVLLVLGSVVPALSGGSNSAGLVVEAALVGLPAGLMLAAWGRALGGLPLARALPAVFVGSAVGATACFAVATVPVVGAALVLKLLPLGSAWALKGLSRPAGDGGDVLAPASGGAEPASDGSSCGERADGPAKGEPAPLSLRALLATSAEREQTARLSLKMAAGTVLFGLAAGFMETYGSDPGMASTPAFPATLLLFVLFCVAAMQLLATGGLDPEGAPSGVGPADASADGSAPSEPEGPLDGVYRLAVLVMMAGFLFVPVLGEFGVPGEAIVLAGYLGLSAVLESLFLVMARITGQDAALSFARGFTALFAGEVAGIALGNVIDVVSGTEQTPYVVVACAGLAALYACLFLFTERDFRALSVIAREADRFDDACALIASECGLSKREAEILPFALKGRTGERIAAEFFISKSTVDTHLRRIYGKCGVHGRQELIDLGERTERRLSGR
ncbi:helix-turn-helix transcriptional regulator [Gordonibacter massiliensis (ex Traore et al. 2017)]|uniref:helix-turn-helix transcriptional regulator n=1 Tax=Gordonibacter massiliensis (ex Traore et al. 2017) TaxID=1841863 RepID=UPI001C8C1B6F|nr:helix-turn-helix transcriptional regulator [Gordonibacter massiliensis (ex Traore et al. 2017)]MBX9034263.1 helix-turn-helix transcriptional regulator [Gordonibacter massiliensis (ex Traore et al. 2017)]